MLDYAWHKANLCTYVESRDAYDFGNYTDTFEKAYDAGQTPIPYMTGPPIFEYMVEEYGKEAFFALLNSMADLWNTLNTVGLTNENLHELLMKRLKTEGWPASGYGPFQD